MRGIRLRTHHRVAVTALAGAALVLSVAGTGLATTPTDDPTEAAAGWLASQLVDGERLEVTFDGDVFPDQGLTADLVLALAAAGVASDSIDAATDWLATQVGSYTGTDFGDTYAGATAKLALVAAATGRDATDFGGTDLVSQLEALETPAGRFSDEATDFETGDPADFSNTITQALAVLGLHRATDTGPPTLAVDYLAGQACDDGGFPTLLDADDCVSNVDATAFAVQALAVAGATDTAAAGAAWLADVQADDGGLAGDEGPNSNSTGLAAAALVAAGEDGAAAAARGWLVALQDGCDGQGTGAIRFDVADGGDPVRATAQALPGLAGVHLGAVSSAGAVADVPLLDCPAAADEAGEPEAAEDDDLADDAEEVDEAEPADDADAEAVATEFPMWLLVAVIAVAVLVVVSIAARARRSGTST